MTIIHELKTDPDVFQATVDGKKTFEIRFNDRGFKVGDELLLKETTRMGYEIANGDPLEYTGRMIALNVVGVMTGPVYGLKDGWVIMSVKRS